ncbi:MAG: hypothetical protein LBJ48_05380 [Coriobacteriales bacterium]|jgi:hypothetical protein|nr:hypothetical protein [Coriobacteriales bacterium]
MVELSLYGIKIVVEFAASAFKRGYTENDLILVISKRIYDETLQEDPNKTLVVGFDSKGNLTELVFNVLPNQRIVIFHAMPCRKLYEERIGKRRSHG